MLRYVCWALLIATAATGCSREQALARASTDGDKAMEVKTVSVKAEDVRRPIELVGTLTATEEATISAEVEGRVTRIIADLGDHVRAGAALMQLDPEKLRYRLEQQRAELTRARARYGVDDTDDSPSTSHETPEVRKVAAELKQAEQAFQRAEELHKRSLLPRQQRDDAEATRNAKRAEYEAAVQNARNLRADIDSAVANVRLAERELRDAEIRAPFEGFVSKRLVSPGDYVKVQTPVAALVTVDPLKLSAEVPERLAPWLKIGQTFQFRVDAYQGEVLTGSIARISPAVNTQTRAFPLEGRVPNPGGRLKPGTFARVRIASERVDHIVTVPAAALQYRYGVNRVFVVSRDHVTGREIKIGDRLGENVEVTDGVKVGEVIAVSQVEKLADGTRVRAAASLGDSRDKPDRARGKGE
jgi:membrane fusion protein, multidrug efflux system